MIYHSIQGGTKCLSVKSYSTFEGYALIIMFSMRQVQVEEIAHDGALQDFAFYRLLWNLYRLTHFCQSGNAPDSIAFHHIGNGQRETFLTQQAHQSDRLDGVSSKREEAIQRTHVALRIQHLGDAGGYQDFLLTFRLYVFRLSYLRFRQRLRVHLAVRSERHLVELHIDIGHHILRQTL